MSKPTTSEAARNPAIELYRVMLIFGICFLHAVQQGPYCKAWFSYLFMFTVTGFVFISGWFGISFKPSKSLKLLTIAIFTVPAMWVLWRLQIPNPTPMHLMIPRLKYCWFLWAYLALMFLAPLLDAAFETMKSRGGAKVLVPLLILVSGWGFLTELRFVRDYMPSTAGIGSCTFLMMATVYLVARCWREFGWFSNWKSSRLVLLLIPLFALTSIGFGKYASLVCIAIAGILFVLFSRLSIPKWLGRLAAFLGPSMFSVYITHTNGIGFEWISRIETMLVRDIGITIFPSYFAAAIAIFVVCVMLDFPRRLAARLFLPMFKKFARYLDDGYDRFVTG